MKKSLLSCVLLLFIIGSAVAQQMRVSGKVTSNSSGNAVEGISVTVKGAKTGTATSATGDYIISVNKGATLVFSGLGFASQEIKVTGPVLDVVLQVTVGDIGEVVVVGGVRRSALISLSDLRDTDMAKAKSGAWWEATGHRALANNSVAYQDRPSMSDFISDDYSNSLRIISSKLDLQS